MSAKNSNSDAEASSSGKGTQPADMVTACVDKTKAAAEQMMKDAVSYTKDHPEQALLAAFAAGYVFQIVPTSRVLGGVMRLVAPLVRPAALYVGLSKFVTPLFGAQGRAERS